MKTLAFFVTPHGLGHAARSVAVMEALLRRVPDLHFEIFTQVPAPFFAQTLGSAYTYHAVACDVGFVQRNLLTADVSATLQELADLMPFRSQTIDALARQIQSLGCRAVVCDIAPLGIAVALKAGIPSVLQDNFTWDWIYADYFERYPVLRKHAQTVKEWNRRATWRIRTEPVCDPMAPADLMVSPVSRTPRLTRARIRERLGIKPGRPAVLVTTGDLKFTRVFYARLAARRDVQFVILGEQRDRPAFDNLLFLGSNSGHYHPDLVGGVDAVICKAGYSTLAEISRAGVACGCVLRSGFRESRVLKSYVETAMSGFCMSPTAFQKGQ